MKTLVVAKRSKYEWERKKFNLSHNEIVKRYSRERANLDLILKSHDKQSTVREMFIEHFSNADIIMMDELKNTSKYDLVIVLGGDNSFTYVSHFISDNIILGINSDPARSVGSLLSYAANDISDIAKLYEKVYKADFVIEKWPRLKASIDGVDITEATSEYFLGERQRNKMSRHILVYAGVEYEQKCSGIIISTGAGSTGWYGSSGFDFGSGRPSNCSWDPTENKAAFIITEPFNNEAQDNYMGLIGNKYDKNIKLYSLNDDDGLVSVDSWEEYSFSRGSEAEISFGSTLNVMRV